MKTNMLDRHTSYGFGNFTYGTCVVIENTQLIRKCRQDLILVASFLWSLNYKLINTFQKKTNII